MPPWAPEALATASPAYRLALEQRMRDAQRRFILERDARLAATASLTVSELLPSSSSPSPPSSKVPSSPSAPPDLDPPSPTSPHHPTSSSSTSHTTSLSHPPLRHFSPRTHTDRLSRPLVSSKTATAVALAGGYESDAESYHTADDDCDNTAVDLDQFDKRQTPTPTHSSPRHLTPRTRAARARRVSSSSSSQSSATGIAPPSLDGLPGRNRQSPRMHDEYPQSIPMYDLQRDSASSSETAPFRPPPPQLKIIDPYPASDDLHVLTLHSPSAQSPVGMKASHSPNPPPSMSMDNLEDVVSARRPPVRRMPNQASVPVHDVVPNSTPCSDCQVWRRRVQQLESKVESLASTLAAREMEVVSLRARTVDSARSLTKTEARLQQECDSLRVTTEFLVRLAFPSSSSVR